MVDLEPTVIDVCVQAWSTFVDAWIDPYQYVDQPSSTRGSTLVNAWINTRQRVDQPTLVNTWINPRQSVDRPLSTRGSNQHIPLLTRRSNFVDAWIKLQTFSHWLVDQTSNVQSLTRGSNLVLTFKDVGGTQLPFNDLLIPAVLIIL